MLVNRRVADAAAFAVTPDDRRGAALAVEHLVELGHRRIAHLGGPPELSPAADRRLGFGAAISAAGVDDNPSLVAWAETFAEDAGIAPMHTLLNYGGRFTAIVAANDMLALDCFDALRAAGLSCPSDVSVIGFNDMPFAERIQPPLTTIRHSPYEMGRQAAELLLEQLADPAALPRTVVLSPTLVRRASTSAPPRAR